MSDEDKRIWVIHTKDDNLFLRRGRNSHWTGYG